MWRFLNKRYNIFSAKNTKEANRILQNIISDADAVVQQCRLHDGSGCAQIKQAASNGLPIQRLTVLRGETGKMYMQYLNTSMGESDLFELTPSTLTKIYKRCKTVNFKDISLLDRKDVQEFIQSCNASVVYELPRSRICCVVTS